MSWDGWLNCLKSDNATKACDDCGIFDLQGNPWATSCTEFQIGQAGAQELKKAIEQGAVGQSKINIAGKGFMVLRNDTDTNTVMAKCGKAGLTACKGNTCIVVSVYNGDDVQPGNNAKQVEFVRNELIVKNNY